VTVFHVPLNTLLFVFAAVGFLSDQVPVLVRKVVFLASLPILIVVAATLWSPDIETGLIKSANLYVSSLLAAGLLAGACLAGDLQRVLRIMLLLLAVLLVFALIVKLRDGFFVRAVRFGMNGPIVFARFMGVAAIVSLLVLTGARRVLALLVFLLAVVWTQSKGPLLSLLIVLTLFSLLEGHGWRRLIAPVAIGLAALVVVGLAAFLTDAPILDRFLLAASFADPGQSAANYGSIGSRVETYAASFRLIEDFPLGVGAGGWAAATGLYYMEYPHNFALEVASELGLVLGPLAVLPYLAFLVSPVRELRYLALFLAFSQQTSGDLLDSRMWLAFSLASIAIRPALPARVPPHRCTA
jgi:O-Antigen ligase